MAVKKGLGKGLDSLIPASAKEKEVVGKESLVDINSVEPNRAQPRTKFEEESLKELEESIRTFGVITPLIVQKKKNYYEIVAGERRWRAAKAAGLKKIPVIVREYTPQEMAEVALIENIQRENLNPIEEAQAYKRLLEEFSLKQEDVAARVAKSRVTITNSLRLLKLDERVQKFVIDGKLTTGHARTLLGASDKEKQYRLARKIIDESLSVRETEKLLQTAKATKKKPAKPAAKNALYKNMENEMRDAFGTKILINEKSRGKGKVEIEYYSEDDLERIYNMLTSYKE